LTIGETKGTADEVTAVPGLLDNLELANTIQQISVQSQAGR
jgi:hypothetical protein